MKLFKRLKNRKLVIFSLLTIFLGVNFTLNAVVEWSSGYNNAITSTVVVIASIVCMYIGLEMIRWQIEHEIKKERKTSNKYIKK